MKTRIEPIINEDGFIENLDDIIDNISDNYGDNREYVEDILNSDYGLNIKLELILEYIETCEQSMKDTVSYDVMFDTHYKLRENILKMVDDVFYKFERDNAL